MYRLPLSAYRESMEQSLPLATLDTAGIGIFH